MGDASDDWLSFCCPFRWYSLNITGDEGVIFWFNVKEIGDFVLIVSVT